MKTRIRNTSNLLKLLLFTTVFLFINTCVAQPGLRQREITVLPTQPIDFGGFIVNGAGTIKVDYQGNVTVSGGVISLDVSSVTPAKFQVKLCKGGNVTIDYDYSVFIDGSNGGQLELIVGPTERGGNLAEFPIEENCEFITTLRVGGTLVVPANAIHGIYTGSFPMTFTQQ